MTAAPGVPTGAAPTDAGGWSTADCDCPSGTGRTVTDPARHAAWHQLVTDQLTDPSRVPHVPAELEPDPQIRAANYRMLRATAIAVLVERPKPWES